MSLERFTHPRGSDAHDSRSRGARPGVAFKSGLYKRGAPETLYVDNGSIYTSKEITQICSRIGTLLCHALVRDGAAKGKVERLFRTVRESFLTRALDLGSVDTLNRAFSRWVEDEYSGVEHSSILMMPIDRFRLDLPRVRFLPPNQVNDEFFYVEEDRSVLPDNTLSFRRTRFEAPRDLRSRKIQIRVDRRRAEHVVVFYDSSSAELSKHGVGVDVLACPCGGRMRWIEIVIERDRLRPLHPTAHPAG